MKFEDRSPEEIVRQGRCARGDAWELAEFSKAQKKKEDKATFDSPSEEWILPAASTINPEEREFAADSGASMHMVSKKDWNKAELETVRISKNPIMVVTASGEVQIKEEATVYVSCSARNTQHFILYFFLCSRSPKGCSHPEVPAQIHGNAGVTDILIQNLSQVMSPTGLSITRSN